MEQPAFLKQRQWNREQREQRFCSKLCKSSDLPANAALLGFANQDLSIVIVGVTTIEANGAMVTHITRVDAQEFFRVLSDITDFWCSERALAQMYDFRTRKNFVGCPWIEKKSELIPSAMAEAINFLHDHYERVLHPDPDVNHADAVLDQLGAQNVRLRGFRRFVRMQR